VNLPRFASPHRWQRTLYGQGAIRPHPYRSARGRLIVVNLLVVAGILALMAIAVYAWEVHATDQQVNDQLHERAAHVLIEEGTATIGSAALPAASTDRRDGNDPLAEQYEPTSPDVFTVLVNKSGVVTFDPGNVRALGLPDVAALQPVLSGRQPSTFVTVGDDQRAFRLYSLPILQRDQIVGALQVGMSLDARYRQLHDLLLILAAVGSGVLVITAVASFYLAGQALQPMRVAYERQRGFAAAASHELRTPLAIVRSEAELVARGLLKLSAISSHSRTPVVSSKSTASPDSYSELFAAQAASNGLVSQGTSLPLDSASPVSRMDSGGLAARLGDDVREIVSEVDYMARLVDDLLLLARDEAAPGQFARRKVDLAAVASEALTKMAPIAHASGLTLAGNYSHDETGGTSGSIAVQGDHDRLKQLVLILLDNAIRYTPRNGTIELSVRRTHERHLLPRRLPGHAHLVELTVRDSGIGIAAEDLAHVFDPFFRSKSARTGGSEARKPEGAGLGLAVARWIVTAHGGAIAVASEPGHGATFTVSLPLA